MINLNMYIVIYPATIKYILLFAYQLSAASIFSQLQLLILNILHNFAAKISGKNPMQNM